MYVPVKFSCLGGSVPRLLNRINFTSPVYQEIAIADWKSPIIYTKCTHLSYLLSVQTYIGYCTIKSVVESTSTQVLYWQFWSTCPWYAILYFYNNSEKILYFLLHYMYLGAIVTFQTKILHTKHTIKYEIQAFLQNKLQKVYEVYS